MVEEGGRTWDESGAALTATLAALHLPRLDEGQDATLSARSWGVSSDTVCLAERWDACEGGVR